jgi:hypothetical protein
MPALTTLGRFNNFGGNLVNGVTIDAAGDLFGTTDTLGANSDGSVYEIVKTSGSYASTPITLASFSGHNSIDLDQVSGLITDSAGDLFGTTNYGGANDFGMVFEIVKTGNSYAGTPTTLLSFSSNLNGEAPGLIIDAAGDLFGITLDGGTNGTGSVYEIVKTGGSYASTATTLASFGAGPQDPQNPADGLVADANGDLFGETETGTDAVFEIVKTGNSYASTPTVLASFQPVSQVPMGGLVVDAAGDLFGTTLTDGGSQITVFEIVKTGNTYASTPTVLATLADRSGDASPRLLLDVDGDIFGTLDENGTSQAGEVFEIAKIGGSYATKPTVVFNFNGSADQIAPEGGLIADPAGNLFGSTVGGISQPNQQIGTVFELSNAGFQVATLPTPDNFFGGGTSDVLFRDDATGDTGFYAISNGANTGWRDVGASSTAYTVVGTGDFKGDGASDVLFRNNSTGDTGFFSQTVTGFGWADVGASSTAYSVVGVGDFNGDGTSDILYRNNTTGDTGFYEIVNGTNTGWHDVGASSAAYSVVGVGDFNGDGTSDILYRNNASGDTGFYAIVNGTNTGWHDVGASSTAYSVVGIGDFNGDGTSDILYRNNATGDTGFYAIVIGTNTGWYDVGASSTAYSVVSVGYYNADRTSDILYRDNTTGDTGFYAIVNGANAGWHDIGASSTAYHVAS